MSAMQSYSSNQTSMTTAQKDFVTDTLSQYDADNLSDEDALSIIESFSSQGIQPSDELMSMMSDLGFDAQSIGDVGKANQGDGQMPPPPPPEGEEASGVDTSDMISYLEEQLSGFSTQLTSSEQQDIYAQALEAFGLSEGSSLISVRA